MSFPVSIIEDSRAFTILKREIDTAKLSHAYMINSVDIGEAVQFARTVIRYTFCRDLCGHCHECLRIEDGNHPDITIINKRERILVDDIKDIVASSHLKAFEGGDKFFIIADAAMLTPQSQNKLLKTLEEAPPATHFFLCTTNPDALLNTVKSRVAKIFLPPKPAADIARALGADYVGQADRDLAARYSGGSITTAQEIMANPELMAAIKYILTLPEKLKSSKDVLNYSEGLLKYKNHMAFLLDVIEIMFSGMLEDYIENNVNEYGYSSHALARITDAVIDAKKKLQANCGAAGVVEYLLFKILEVKKTCR